jgi:hypothetical protein
MTENVEISRRRRASSPSAAAVLDDDNLLGQILIRLPPGPSTLLRASLVCKRWRRLVSDPGFLRIFRTHHRKPPLIGFFFHFLTFDIKRNIDFTPVLDLPDRIPDARFFSPLVKGSQVIGCRHGRVLVISRKRRRFQVWDPVTRGYPRCVSFPPPFRGKEERRKNVKDGAVICAAGDQGHVHGACHTSPYQLVLLGCDAERISACVYSSETLAWGNLVSILRPPETPDIYAFRSNTLVGNSIYWLLDGVTFAILEFDLDRQSLAVIEVPQDAVDLYTSAKGDQPLITAAEGGELGFLILTGFSVRMWKRKADDYGVSEWVHGNTIDLKDLLGPNIGSLSILGLAEDINVMFLWTDDEVFIVDLELAKFKKLPQRISYCSCFPFTSFYAAGK